MLSLFLETLTLPPWINSKYGHTVLCLVRTDCALTGSVSWQAPPQRTRSVQPLGRVNQVVCNMKKNVCCLKQLTHSESTQWEHQHTQWCLLLTDHCRQKFILSQLNSSLYVQYMLSTHLPHSLMQLQCLCQWEGAATNYSLVLGFAAGLSTSWRQ